MAGIAVKRVPNSPRTYSEIPSFVSGDQFERVVQQEWDEIEKVTSVKPEEKKSVFATGLMKTSEEKNRYDDVLANEKSRVHLHYSFRESEEENELTQSMNDYINANKMGNLEPLCKNMNYIAGQAPLENTVKDFYRMIWYEDVSLVLMLGKEVEGGSIKSEVYWPTAKKNKLCIDKFRVEWESETTEGVIIVRKLKLFKEDSKHPPRKLIHLQYIGWPDRGVPTGVEEFFQMMDKVDAIVSDVKKEHPKKIPTLLLHCSAGLGRTGVFLAVHSTKHHLLETKNFQEEFNILELVRKIRDDRAGMIQTQAQFQFTWKALAHLISQLSSKK